MSFAPQEVVGVSFQMSFAAVLALISGYEALRPVLTRLYGHQWWRRTISHVIALLLTSLLAGTASAPYGAFHFGHIQLYFIAANVLAVPLTAMWVMPLGLLGLALMPFGLESLALTPMGWGVQAILFVGQDRVVVAGSDAGRSADAGLGAAGVQPGAGRGWRCGGRAGGCWGVVPIVAGLLSPALTVPLPDLLVSGDARLIALRSGTGYAVLAARLPARSKFTREEWETAFRGGPVRAVARRACRPLVRGAGLSCQIGPVLLVRNKAKRMRRRWRATGWRCWWRPSRLGASARTGSRCWIGSRCGGTGRRPCGSRGDRRGW